MIGMRSLSSSAVLSGDDVYRYELARDWKPGGRGVVFVMLNPSIADAEVDDPTIRRCIGFAQREGFARLKVVNLFALRATKPVELTRHPDPIGPENVYYVKRALAASWEYPLVIAAWGANPPFDRDRWLRELAGRLRRPLFCLGKTKRGQPRHPLYLKADARLVGL